MCACVVIGISLPLWLLHSKTLRTYRPSFPLSAVQFCRWPEWNLFGGMWLLWLLALSWIGHRLDWHGHWLSPGLRSSPSEMQRMRIDDLIFRYTYHYTATWSCLEIVRHWLGPWRSSTGRTLRHWTRWPNWCFSVSRILRHTVYVIFAQICCQAVAPLCWGRSTGSATQNSKPKLWCKWIAGLKHLLHPEQMSAISTAPCLGLKACTRKLRFTWPVFCSVRNSESKYNSVNKIFTTDF